MHKFDVVLANLRNFDFLVCDLDFTHVGALALATTGLALRRPRLPLDATQPDTLASLNIRSSGCLQHMSLGELGSAPPHDVAHPRC